MHVAGRTALAPGALLQTRNRTATATPLLLDRQVATLMTTCGVSWIPFEVTPSAKVVRGKVDEAGSDADRRGRGGVDVEGMGEMAH